MSVDYQSIIGALQQYNPSISGVVVTSMMGGIYYNTPNWNPDPNEVKKVVGAWSGGSSISVHLAGVKFSVLQTSPERFISTSIKKQGHLVGAKTPDGGCVLAYVLPDGAYDGAYMDVARAASQLRPGGSASGLGVTAATGDTVYSKKDVSQAQLQNSGGYTQQGGQGQAAAGGADAQDVQQLIQWIQDPNGLVNFINYCIQNQDWAKIQSFAKFYRTLRQLLG